GSDMLSINGSDSLSINGSDALSINGSDSLSINGSDMLSINGSDAMRVNNANLLALGQVDAIGDGFISVLGQTVFGSGNDFAGISNGATVAIYGSIDRYTGGFANTRVLPVSRSSFSSGAPSFLRGTVDAVDVATGRAIVGGMMVDYNAMLSQGMTPNVGDQVAVSGRAYRGLGLLVAEPGLRLSGRQ
ncbi:MAG: hypothetical protein KJO35_05345, partial [Gammaproteobacteria bacterium]|nr:hypothetical protein [Gammaproteobacteria bacterium]